MKTCSKCKQPKPLVEFSRDCHAKDGLTYHCKLCASATAAAQRERNPGKHAAAAAEWRKKNPERNAALIAAWNVKHPEKRGEYCQKSHLKKTYGLTLDDYEALVLKFGGKCGICQTLFRCSKDQNIDHCHKTGKVRGLLCRSCNQGIGQLGDSPERLRAAAAYLEAALDKPTPGGVE